MSDLNPFKKPKAPKQDTSALQAQEARLKEQEEKLAAEEAEREAKDKRRRESELNARRGRSGGRSLLFGLETGVATDDKRGTLG